MTPEERITELENNCKAMTAEIEKLKAELAEKDKHEIVWIPEFSDSYMYINSSGGVFSRDNNASDNDNRRIDFNNVYRPNDKTQEHLKWYSENVLRVQNKLMQLHELLCSNYFPNWKIIMKSNFIYITIMAQTYGIMIIDILSVIMWFISLKKQQKRLARFSTERSL